MWCVRRIPITIPSTNAPQLYSFVAQTDNRLSARLAAVAGRDSTSMKILAFITTIFLPGSYVAVCSTPHRPSSNVLTDTDTILHEHVQLGRRGIGYCFTSLLDILGGCSASDASHTRRMGAMVEF
jgi:hypothetical protein